jgi:hypothetical protein
MFRNARQSQGRDRGTNARTRQRARRDHGAGRVSRHRNARSRHTSKRATVRRAIRSAPSSTRSTTTGSGSLGRTTTQWPHPKGDHLPEQGAQQRQLGKDRDHDGIACEKLCAFTRDTSLPLTQTHPPRSVAPSRSRPAPAYPVSPTLVTGRTTASLPACSSSGLPRLVRSCWQHRRASRCRR